MGTVCLRRNIPAKPLFGRARCAGWIVEFFHIDNNWLVMQFSILTTTGWRCKLICWCTPLGRHLQIGYVAPSGIPDAGQWRRSMDPIGSMLERPKIYNNVELARKSQP